MTKLEKLRIQANDILLEIATALIDGEFASIKFDNDERQELAHSIRHSKTTIDAIDSIESMLNIVEALNLAHEYVVAETCDLRKVPIVWITSRDLNELKRQTLDLSQIRKVSDELPSQIEHDDDDDKGIAYFSYHVENQWFYIVLNVYGEFIVPMPGRDEKHTSIVDAVQALEDFITNEIL